MSTAVVDITSDGAAEISRTGSVEVEKVFGVKESLGVVKKFRGRLPYDFEFDRFEANERWDSEDDSEHR